RAIGDWLLGMNATRLYTLKYGGYKQVLSVGRVQTPTLAMLVNRHHEIENFVSKPFWELQTKYRDAIFNNTEGKFLKKEHGEKFLNQVKGKELVITAISKKDGKEYAPKLFDLTGIQVYCNNKFGFTAESTLKMVQSLYEKKVVSYPRVDTTFLPNDMYPKVSGILKGLSNYSAFTESLLGKTIRKSTKVFNDNKVTDHHAIIPTGQQNSLGIDEQKVYDIIVRRFIAVFYPDCKVAKTQVDAEVDSVKFVTKGKEIFEAGWRVLFAKEKKESDEETSKDDEEENLLPSFVKDERGPHTPSFLEKTTKPPSYYTEASLLRAMETAGKQVDDEELRDLMKENGIGRPSTRANIIETLFRRKYTQRRKKQVLPTEMGIQLIGTIQNDLLKSAELTGQWEKQLKEIEQGEHSAKQFIVDMKNMVNHLIYDVKHETGKARMVETVKPKAVKGTKKSASSDSKCPKCKEGKLIKGKTVFGCSRWKEGCDLRLPFQFLDKKLTDKQVFRLAVKGTTTKIKGFKVDGKSVEGILKLNPTFEVEFEPSVKFNTKFADVKSLCPKCMSGSIVKGQSAFGCSEWKEGCNFRFSFDAIRAKANGQTLNKELILKIIRS
ncbi:MAG: DNA topoisomerase III, partial [Flavobacteriales bacterium]|nr:DNA topoisomerase III [Flavobacteriales bacterium]